MSISVYITSFNQKQYLVEAVESVLRQTFRPDQIIIVDDCSGDGSQELIAAFQTQYPELITPICHLQNTGIAQVRIDALNAVTGDYVTYVDGDDRYLPTKLEKEIKLLQSTPHAQIAYSNYFYITESGDVTGIWADSARPPEGYVFCQTFARDFPRRSLFRNELVDYHAWKRIGFYDPALQLYEDYEMRIRLTKHLQTVYCNEPLAEYRLHKTGLASLRLERHFLMLDYIYQKNKPLLNDLSSDAKKYVSRKCGEWIAERAKGATVEAIRERHFFSAAKLALFTLRYNPNLIYSWPWLIYKNQKIFRQTFSRQQTPDKNSKKDEELVRTKP